MARGDLVAWHGCVGGGCGVFLPFLFLGGLLVQHRLTQIAVQTAVRRATTSTRTLATLDLLLNV